MALIKDENISKAQNYFLGYMDAKKDMKEKVNKAIEEIRKLLPKPTHEANELFGGITCAEILDFINDEKTIIEADKVERTNEEQVLNGFYEMMKGLWGNQDLKMPNSVSERPPADVVERSKIDKAIAEIEDYTVEDNCEDGVMFALDTLKRCLKEIRR